MKFREIILTIMAIAVMMVFSDKTMAAPSVPATGITLPTEISVAPGNSKQLKATLIPSDSTSAITWKSWDESVVKVNAAGVISGVKKGAAYVTAAANGKSAKTLVRVEIPAIGISLSRTEVTLNVGARMQLKAMLTPSNASTKVIWKSWDEELFKVDQYGIITTMKPGVHYVTAASNGKSARCLVRVVIPVNGITLPTEASVAPGRTRQLKPILTPSNATSQITWKSWNEDILKVNSLGLVTGIKTGAAYVTAAANGKSAKILIRVELPATGISFQQTEMTMKPGEKIT